MKTKLQEAVIKQLGDEDILIDVVEHGASSGFSGFTYYTDTITFFKKNKKEILELVKEMSNEFGQTPMEFVKSFLCLESKDNEFEDEIGRTLYGRPLPDDVQVQNALAWFALEEVARQLKDN